MKILNKILLMFVLVTTLFSCDDVLEEDITNDSIKTIQPIEGYVNDGNTVQFSWQDIDGADKYRIQIINENQVLEVDSLITANSFSMALDTGEYKWQVRGENFAYVSSFTLPVNFSVQTSENLENQSVTLLTPSNNLYSNNPNFTFTWDDIETASTYTFELAKKMNGEETVLQQPDIAETSFAVSSDTFDDDAEYIWKVKALNETSSTEYAERSIFVDRVVPNQPTLTLPADNSTSATKAITFNWTNGVDTGNIKSAITNTIEIASDENFDNLIQSITTNANSYQYTFSTVGSYYWRVIAEDRAKNKSDYSIVRSVIIE